eukprot:TRINITY_DN3511_c5_g1_i1.p1 TRINITY_DN3511_c5_g1~~TRINITY_DN3511_c5_g1_i1.p1  ORF type:complete len:550 (+),score=130.79 TRINITY_DN3511_c5_g1_i1:31-1680(+)
MPSKVGGGKSPFTVSTIKKFEKETGAGSSAVTEDRSTDDTVGHEGEVTARKERARMAQGPLKRGVPEEVKARWRSNSPSSDRFAKKSSSPGTKKERSRTPPLTARGPATPAGHAPKRSVTPASKQGARRRSMTPTTVRSLSQGGGGTVSWQAIIAPNKRTPKPTSPRSSKATPYDSVTPRSATTMPHAVLSPEKATPTSSAVNPSPRTARWAGLSPRSVAQTLTFSRPTADDGSAMTPVPSPAPTTPVDTVLSPQRRSVTMTQNQPKRKKQPIFVAALPLPPKAAKHAFTLVLDLDQTLVNAHNVDDTVVPRPFMLEALDEFGHCKAERVLWTASNEAQAKFVLKKSPGMAQHFDYIVTWDTLGWGNRRDYVKDIVKLRRSTSSTLVVDNDHMVVRPHIHSALVVEDYGDLQGGSIRHDDMVMLQVAKFVKEMSMMRPEIDVPSFVRTNGSWVGKKKTGFYKLQDDAPFEKLTARPANDTASEATSKRSRADSKKRQANSQTYTSPLAALSTTFSSPRSTKPPFQRTTTQVKKTTASPTRSLFVRRGSH